MYKTIRTTIQKIRTLSRPLIVSGSALMLIVALGISVSVSTPKASAQEITNWQIIYPEPTTVLENPGIGMAACKTTSGSQHTIKVLVTNSTTHHRTWTVQHLRPNPPGTLFFDVISTEGPKNEWQAASLPILPDYFRRDVTVSATQGDQVLVRLFEEPFDPNNPVLPISRFVNPATLNNCQLL